MKSYYHSNYLNRTSGGIRILGGINLNLKFNQYSNQFNCQVFCYASSTNRIAMFSIHTIHCNTHLQYTNTMLCYISAMLYLFLLFYLLLLLYIIHYYSCLRINRSKGRVTLYVSQNAKTKYSPWVFSLSVFGCASGFPLATHLSI